MSDLEALIRDIVRDELQAVTLGNTETQASRPALARPSRRRASDVASRPNFDSLTPAQKAARTRKLRAAGYKAWETRRRNAAAAAPIPR